MLSYQTPYSTNGIYIGITSLNFVFSQISSKTINASVVLPHPGSPNNIIFLFSSNASTTLVLASPSKTLSIYFFLL